MTLRPGDRLLLEDGTIAEVLENMEDGMWIQVRYLEVPRNPAEVGAIELCHAQDIAKLLNVT
ncbi:hypothetical protein HCN50_06510 [Bradyrhizobium sp. WSM 1744]|uniref:Uncharacterized protein n=1 Tax=Bradyrhizobium archetypum TaxID=2721160 RepID=A0A7Y4H1Z5_9BRAD|nr:hypothetical protein [Bradyrhizobium archetypum]